MSVGGKIETLAFRNVYIVVFMDGDIDFRFRH